MTEWIKCSERLPKSKRDPYRICVSDEVYEIVVSINGKYFIGEAQNIFGMRIMSSDTIIFNIPTREWLLPRHYRMPDFWMELPQTPKD